MPGGFIRRTPNADPEQLQPRLQELLNQTQQLLTNAEEIEIAEGDQRYHLYQKFLETQTKALGWLEMVVNSPN